MARKMFLLVLSLFLGLCACSCYAFCAPCLVGLHHADYNSHVFGCYDIEQHTNVLETWHNDYGPGESGTYDLTRSTTHTKKYTLDVSAAYEGFGLSASWDDATIEHASDTDHINYSACQCKVRDICQDWQIEYDGFACGCNCSGYVKYAQLKTWFNCDIRAKPAWHTENQIPGCLE